MGGQLFPAKHVWKTKAQSRIAFFVWEPGRECILTIDTLMKKGKEGVNRCYLCKKAAETCNHLLLWCPVACSLWSMVYGLFGISCVIVGSVKDEIWAWGSLCKKKKITKIIPFIMFWVI